jgi:D-glycero-alpha-D-manno-heptose 1-phosphate guanylyltransferase
VTTTAVILAGGFGSRLREVVSDLPKPMAPVNGQPFLSYLMRYLNHFGVKHVVMSVGHLAEKITAKYQASFLGISVSYAVEETPLGTGGGLRKALLACSEDHVLALNGDSFFDVDLRKFHSQHLASRSSMSVALRKTDDASRYGAIKTADDGRIESFAEKQSESGLGLINGGTYLIDRNWFLSETHDNRPFSLEKDFMENRAGSGSLNGFEFTGYFIDIGVPEDYARAQHEFKAFKY